MGKRRGKSLAAWCQATQSRYIVCVSIHAVRKAHEETPARLQGIHEGNPGKGNVREFPRTYQISIRTRQNTRRSLRSYDGCWWVEILRWSIMCHSGWFRSFRCWLRGFVSMIPCLRSCTNMVCAFTIRTNKNTVSKLYSTCKWWSRYNHNWQRRSSVTETSTCRLSQCSCRW